MPLKQHEFYVYHSEGVVLARKLGQRPVVAEEFATAQAAHDRVQQIVNPDGLTAADLGWAGFNSPKFQNEISDNCRDYVEAAYAKLTAE